MKYYYLLLLAICLTACQADYHYDYSSDIPAEEMVNTDAAVSTGAGEYDQLDSSAGKKMVREGSVEMRSADVHAVKKYMDAQVSKYRGYYSSVNFGGSQDYREPEIYRLEVKIPSQSFDDFTAAISQSGGTIERVNIQAVDVTDKYIDYEIRIASQKSYLERYRQLLGKLNTVKEIIELQERIRLLEQEIESTEARFRELGGRIQYSTLAITIRPIKSAVTMEYKEPGFLRRVGDAIQYGWEVVKSFIIGLLYIWPLILLLAVGGYLFVHYRSKKSNS